MGDKHKTNGQIIYIFRFFLLMVKIKKKVDKGRYIFKQIEETGQGRYKQKRDKLGQDIDTNGQIMSRLQKQINKLELNIERRKGEEKSTCQSKPWPESPFGI